MGKNIQKFDVYFAGLARDCEETLKENLSNVLRLCDTEEIKDYDILIAENDSEDNTRRILQQFAEQGQNIELLLLDALDEQLPVREQRIAHLREILFNKIQNMSNQVDSTTSKLYVPIDLDSKIAQSISKEEFIKECQRVATGETDAVFPASEPYYYDIYALRAKGWVEEDCWNQVRKSRKKKGSFISKVKYVYSKQKSIEKLKEAGRIPVQSAFGGVGIYNLKKLSDTSYKPEVNYPKAVCEHTIFNRSVESMEISTEFVVRAPRNHIKYKVSNWGKIRIFISSTWSDIRFLLEN